MPVFAPLDHIPHLGPPVERLEYKGSLCSVVQFSRETLAQQRVFGHYWGTETHIHSSLQKAAFGHPPWPPPRLPHQALPAIRVLQHVEDFVPAVGGAAVHRPQTRKRDQKRCSCELHFLHGSQPGSAAGSRTTTVPHKKSGLSREQTNSSTHRNRPARSLAAQTGQTRKHDLELSTCN